MRSLFISDLHLTPGRPDITRAFLRFLNQQAIALKTHSLYILGDFFAYWIGDDVMDTFQNTIAAALRRLSNTGTVVFFMHGNRDFLIGEQFCRAAGCTLLPDPSVITLNGEPVLLMHGDSLCTGDKGYIYLRTALRNPWLQKLFLALPGRIRNKIAEKLRKKSMIAAANKPPSLMDVTPEAVDQALARFQAKTLIHGHTHRAHIHTLADQQQRIVLGDWDQIGWYLSHDHNGFQLINLPIANTYH